MGIRIGAAALAITAIIIVLILLSPLFCSQPTGLHPAVKAPNYQATVIDPDFNGGLIIPQNNAYLLWGTDGIILHSNDGIDWTQAQTNTTQEILNIALNNDGSRLVAVGMGGTIITSTDGGLNWQQVQGIDTDVIFTSIVYVPNTDRWIAGGHNGTLAFSKENPSEWLASNSSITDHIFDLMVIPNTDKILFGGDNGLLAISTDGGSNWKVVPPESRKPIRQFHQVNELIFGLSSDGQVVLTRDAANSWQLLDTHQKVHFNDLAYDKKHNAIVIASSGGNVLVSHDNGHNWNISDVVVNNQKQYLNNVIYDEINERLLIFGNFGTVAYSMDGGLNWAPLPPGHQEHHNVTLFNQVKNQFVSAGVRGFKAHSADLTLPWHIQQYSLDYYWRDALATPDDAITMVGALGKIIRSEDNGLTWQYPQVAYPDANTPPSYRALRYNSKTKRLFAAGPTGIIMGSDDYGKTWSTLYYTPFEQGEAFADLEIDPLRNTAFALEAFKGPYFSEDSGNSWRREPVIDERQFWHSSLLSTAKHSIGIAVGQGGLVATSNNGGKSWSSHSLPFATEDFYGSFADAKTGQLFAMGKNGQLIRSQDFGKSWAKLQTPNAESLRRMIREPKQQALLCTGTAGTVLRSIDDGDTWQLIATPATDELRQLIIEPETKNIVVMGREGMLMRSEDAGLSWQILASHTQKHFRHALFHPQTGDIIAFGERVVHLKKLPN